MAANGLVVPILQQYENRRSTPEGEVGEKQWRAVGNIDRALAVNDTLIAP
jgi:hypothetical protein